LWPIEADAEITLEANRNSAEAEKFAGFRAAGLNLLSPACSLKITFALLTRARR